MAGNCQRRRHPERPAAVAAGRFVRPARPVGAPRPGAAGRPSSLPRPRHRRDQYITKLMDRRVVPPLPGGSLPGFGPRLRTTVSAGSGRATPGTTRPSAGAETRSFPMDDRPTSCGSAVPSSTFSSVWPRLYDCPRIQQSVRAGARAHSSARPNHTSAPGQYRRSDKNPLMPTGHSASPRHRPDVNR